MIIRENVSLKPYNTFGVDVKTPKFVEVATIEELKKILSTREIYFILGGGSNMLLTKDLELPVLHIALKGITVVKENANQVWVEAKAGENWHEFVLYCLEQGWGGMENLSLIPGNVGTTPVQNIGAYGVEIKDFMDSCKVVDIHTLEEKELTNVACEFGYRESIFKGKAKGRYIITSVVYRFTKKHHQLNLEYGAIRSVLEEKNIKNPTPKQVSNAVISIRQNKLPDPKVLGNSGSFFKNPVVSKDVFEEIYRSYPQAPYYRMSENKVKIPAGWLIEKCGFKGYREGDAAVHTQQALVLVNYGSATGSELWTLAQHIQKEVSNKFGISLEIEVNVF